MKITKSISFEEYQRLLENEERYEKLSKFLREWIEEKTIEEINPVTDARRRYVTLTDYNTMKLFELLHPIEKEKGDESKWTPV